MGRGAGAWPPRGHLATAIRRKTGRTVGGWFAERSMAGARLLLVVTDPSVE
jgi:AraC family transcriptional activator of pobA